MAWCGDAYLGQTVPIGIVKTHQKTGPDCSNAQRENLGVNQVLYCVKPHSPAHACEIDEDDCSNGCSLHGR